MKGFMKRQVFLLLAILLAFTLTACGKKDDNVGNSGNGGNTNTEENAGNQGNGGNTGNAGSTNSNGGFLSREDDETEPKTGTAKTESNTTDDNASVSEATGVGEGAQGITDRAPITLDGILLYIETGSTDYFTPHKLSSSEQEELRKNIEKEGGKVSFDQDGTIHITGEGSTKLVIHPDGSYEGTDADGQSLGVVSSSSEWPDSAFGKAVPKPDFDIGMQMEDGEGLMILFENVTMADAEAYGKKLAEAGFTNNANEMKMSGVGMYSYSGGNSDGIDVEFNYLNSGGTVSCGLTVEKHKEYSDYDDYGDYGDFGDYSDFGDDSGEYYPGYGDYGDTDYDYLSALFSDSWPSSGLLTLVDEPDFGDGFKIDTYEDKVSASVLGATKSDYDAYVKSVKAKGFTLDSETDEYPEDDLYMYTGFNSKGNGCLVQLYMGELGIIVTIPE
ncbi:MAG: hypothetical protein J6Y89_04240 [Lachnospiraceae bacterium]|nr:hypothetical protein [Lachnospiraceae bacterium]